MTKFEEYKFISDSTMRLSDRRQANAQIYLGISTAILGVLVSLFSSPEEKGIKLLAASIALFVVGLTVCIVWYAMIESYRRLVNWRFSLLKQMELEPELEKGMQLYRKEDEFFYGKRHKQTHVSFSKLEKFLPILFIILDTVFFTGAVLFSLNIL